MRLLFALLACATLTVWAAVSFTLDAVPPGPSVVGQRVTLVSYVSGLANPQYRFEVRTSSGVIRYSRDWATGRSTWWTPAMADTYTVKALVRSGSAGTPMERTTTYMVNAPLSEAWVWGTELGMLFTVGTPVTFSAGRSGGAVVEYRPLIGYSTTRYKAKDITWDQTRPWGSATTWTFTPDRMGYFYLRIYARERGSTRYFDVSSGDWLLEPAQSTVTDFTLTVAPTGSLVVGSAITITVTNVMGGVQPVWRFVAYSRAENTWTLIREYSASRTATWLLPSTPGTYNVFAIARESWKTGTTSDLTRKVPVSAVAGQKVNAKDGSVLVYVPAGEFLMGTPSNATYGHDESEHPQRTVYLNGYWIMRDEVTSAQYQAFCTATGRSMPSGWPGTNPMVNVSWYDASAYAAWAGLVLTTEAQWEKAARGADGRLFPWGSTWSEDSCANKTNSFNNWHYGPWPVGSFLADTSPYGCRDMAGNVAEWCADWYAAYDLTATSNPVGPVTGVGRVLRGGSWRDADGTYARGGGRRQGDASGFSGAIGFRCMALMQPAEQ